MYAKIWQGYDLSKFDDYYAKNFEETIHVCDENKNPIEINMKYNDLFKQAIWQKENYKNTTRGRIRSNYRTCFWLAAFRAGIHLPSTISDNKNYRR